MVVGSSPTTPATKKTVTTRLYATSFFVVQNDRVHEGYIFINKDEALFSISLIGGISYMNQYEESLINTLRKIGEDASEQLRII